MEKCFADAGARCLALNEKECLGCNFYKTEEQLSEELKALKRGGYPEWKKVRKEVEDDEI